MSTRKQVIDGIEDALTNSTGIRTVTRDLIPWWDYDDVDYPIVTMLDRVTERALETFPSTGLDREARVQLNVRGYLYDRNNNLADKRQRLIADIEVAMQSTDVTSVAAAVYPMNVETDDGTLENYSVIDNEFEVVYFYNKSTP